MADTMNLDGKRVVVMGLGRFGGGIAVARWLVESGATVTVTDLASAGDLAESVAQLNDLPVSFCLGRHDVADLDGCDLLVVSPAVPKSRSDFVAEAIRRGIPISSEMNLFAERCPARRVIGITGSAGKSTTTAMIGAVLDRAVAAGTIPAAWVGGNIGRSLLSDLDRIGPDDVVALELSSFQLEDLAAIRWSPSLAIVTNLSPNHFDRHGDMDGYVDAKMNILRFQPPGSKVLVHVDAANVAEAVTQAGAASRLERYAFDEGFKDAVVVPGEHNHINASAAITVARELGIADDVIRQGLAEFHGLPHRLELVGEHGRVRYYNDSKSTTPESTQIALDAFDEPVVMLVGGRDKDLEFGNLSKQLATQARGVVCYGETGGTLFEMIAREVAADGASRVALTQTLPEAVQRAGDMALPGDVVVLSPACASYDMFTNYEARGDAFRQIVQSLS